MINKSDFDVLVIRDYYPSVNNPTSSTWVYNQVIGLQEFGFNPLVISPTPVNPLRSVLKNRFQLYDKPSSCIEEYKETHVIRPPYFKIPLDKLKGYTINSLSKSISKHGNLSNIKLIHAHFGQNGVAALPLKEKLKVPLITSFYGYDSGRLGQLFKPYYTDLIRKGDLFLALSQNMKNDLLRLGFPENKILVHRLGVDITKFKSSPISSKPFTMLTVARLDECKGIQYVIKALNEFFRKYPKERERVIYKIVGGGAYEKELKALAKELIIEDNIKFINNLVVPNGREVVLSEMKKCDLFLLCSSTPKSGGKEGTPVVLMEAQACGKPCIATYHAGIPEVVIKNKTGILVNEHSYKETCEAISRLYFDTEKRTRFGENAREHIRNSYNSEVQMNELSFLFNQMLQKHK